MTSYCKNEWKEPGVGGFQRQTSKNIKVLSIFILSLFPNIFECYDIISKFYFIFLLAIGNI